MKVKSISLSNYRGFTQLDLEFGSQITVLAGVNGSGKSAVLRGLAALLSHLLRHEGVSKEKPESLSAGDVHVGKAALTLSGQFQSGGRVLHAQLTRSLPDPSKAPEYAKRRDDARAAMRYEKKGSVDFRKLEDEIRFLSGLLEQHQDHFTHQVEATKIQVKGETGVHPIAALYTTSRYLGRLSPRLSGVRTFEPANAFTDALSGAEVSLTAFANWFRAAQEGALGTKANSKRLLGYLNAVVEKLLPGFSSPKLAETSPPRFVVKKGRLEFGLIQLSDGERGLLALAFDLTRRLSIANPGLKDPVAEGEAIVLLDEIELHLHPGWQRKVLGRLAETFKNCQFIATTHSPQVIGEAPAGSVWMLESDECQISAWKPDHTFGMDANRLLEELMGADAQNAGVKQRLHEIGILVDKDDFKKASSAIEALEKVIGPDHPELIRLRSLIAFVTGKK